ncbi:hypothetical protein CDAR_423101 [Caerostris darwini]|uniref:Uncharacterized protein n=1 Tax=Caerostris darwini TaxID=1538125 RepID=A0AAV4TJ28_9ARAC|nr:hypothetical protein CDAR_423101 [Caerostris darwini]
MGHILLVYGHMAFDLAYGDMAMLLTYGDMIILLTHGSADKCLEKIFPEGFVLPLLKIVHCRDFLHYKISLTAPQKCQLEVTFRLSVVVVVDEFTSRHLLLSSATKTVHIAFCKPQANAERSSLKASSDCPLPGFSPL